MSEVITARQATPGTTLRLVGPMLGWLGGVEQVVMRATVVRWEGNGDGTANLVAHTPWGEQYAGIYGPDHPFSLWG